MTTYVQRFSRWQRAQHLCVMLLFTLLCATGLPQRFFDSGWAQWMLSMFGGVDRARWIHRACGLSFTGLMAVHFAVENNPGIRAQAEIPQGSAWAEYGSTGAFDPKFRLGSTASSLKSR